MADEDELWFLPGPPEDVAPTDMPLPVADRRVLFEPRDWQRAEATQGRGLANAAAAFARLDARMNSQLIVRGIAPGSVGFSKRLGLVEVSAWLWAQGDWVEVEKIALYSLLRESSLHDAQILSAADWATRRLQGAGVPDDLGAFLGRHRSEHDGLADLGQHPVGIEFDGLALDWQGVRAALKGTHPITQAAALFSAWRTFGLSEPGAVLEAGVAAAKVGVLGARALRFLPVASGGALGQGGDVDKRLARWYASVENACLRAEMQLDQLTAWLDRATMTTKHLSGKTPPLLIEALLETPALSAAMAAAICGCDKATARRNLNAFAKLGLIREITGHGRYQLWVVA